MSLYEPLIIATAAASGASLIVPEKYDDTMSLLLAMLAGVSKMYGLHLESQGQANAALNATMASIMFGVLSAAKVLKLT